MIRESTGCKEEKDMPAGYDIKETEGVQESSDVP